jgi:hypothetical protein
MKWLVILIVAETLVQQNELLSDNGKVKRGRRIEIHLEGGNGRYEKERSTCWAAIAPLLERAFGGGPELALEAESKFITG